MADKVRGFDWHKTPLGPIEDWPISLKTVVGIVLDAPELRVLLWGPEMITIYNDATFIALGERRDEGLAVPYPELRPANWIRIKPYLLAAQAGAPRLIAHLREVTRPNGTLENVPYSLSITPVGDDSGGIGGLLLDGRELALDSAGRSQPLLENMRFRQLFAEAPILLATGTAPDFCFQTANTAYQALVGDRPLIGRTAAEAFPELADHDFVKLLTQVATTGEPVSGRDCPIDLRSDDGTLTRRYVDFSYQPIKDGSGQTVGVFCVGSDVSEQHEAREQAARLQIELAHASRMSAMETMAQTLAHELNQPLAAASNFVSGGLRLVNGMDCEPKPAVEEALRLAKGQIERAGAIVRGARSILQDANPRRDALPLGPIVGQALGLIPAEERDGVHFEVAKGLDSYEVVVNPTQIEQVLINLGRNACQAMAAAERRELSISAQDNGKGFVEILVRDSGPGICASQEDSLFSAFSSSSTGLGVGLSLSRTLIEAHGGRLWGRNNAKGGATFGFTLPVPPAADQGADGSGGGT